MDSISLSLLLHLTKVKDWQVSFLHTYLCSSPAPSPSSTPVALPLLNHKRSRPPRLTRHMCGVNLNHGAMVMGHAAAVARGVCRHEACQRAFKEPRPRKRKQMAAGITPLMDCTCSPCAPLPRLPFNQCPENPLGALKWKNVSMLGLYSQHQITRCLLTPVQCWAQKPGRHNSCLWPALSHCCSPANMWLIMN